MSALVASVNVTAENGRPAVLDRKQNAPGVGVQQMPKFFDQLFAVSADYIGHLARWPARHGSVTLGPDSASNGLTICCT